MQQKGYTQKVMNYLAGKIKNPTFNYEELAVVIGYKGETFWTTKTFWKHFTFLETLTAEDFDKEENQKAKEFLMSNIDSGHYWKSIPVETAIAVTNDLWFLDRLGKQSPKLKQKTLDRAKVIMRAGLVNVNGPFSMTDHIIKFWEMSDGSPMHREYAAALIDQLSADQWDYWKELYNAGVVMDDIQLGKCLSALFVTNDVTSSATGHGLFNDLNRLFSLFYDRKVLIDSMVSYLQQTTSQKEKADELLKDMRSVLQKLTKVQTQENMKVLWLPLLQKCSEYSTGFVDMVNLLPPYKSNRTVANVILKNILANLVSRGYFLLEDQLLALGRYVGKCNTTDLYDSIIDQFCALSEKKDGIMFYIPLLYRSLGKDKRLLDLGMERVNHPGDNGINHVLSFLELLQQEDKMRYKRYLKQVQGRLLPGWIEKESKGTVTRLVVQHFC